MYTKRPESANSQRQKVNREGGGGWRATAAGDQSSLSSDKNALKSDSGDGCTPLKTTELYTLQE